MGALSKILFCDSDKVGWESQPFTVSVDTMLVDEQTYNEYRDEYQVVFNITTPQNVEIYYRTNIDNSWTLYESGQIIYLSEYTSYVQFVNMKDYNSDYGSIGVFNIGSYDTFCQVKGNIQSLLNYSDTAYHDCFYELFAANYGISNAKNLYLPATIVEQFCYSNMFYNCYKLQESPLLLPATTLAHYCYDCMFQECYSLITAPELPATTLASYCYYMMFSTCDSLITAPELPATTLADSCYGAMFTSCSNLTEAPELPATTLASNCYYMMFDNCSKLNYIKVGFTSWYSGATDDWVNGVASNGTFIKPEALDDTRGTAYIPQNWTVENY